VSGAWYTLRDAYGDGNTGDGGRSVAATQEQVEHVMSHVSWLLVRGVFQALPVGDAYVDPDTVASQGGGAVGAVGVIRTALRGAALMSVGSSRLRLLDAMPTHGPVTGNTEVSLQGTGLLTLLVPPSSALPSSSYSPVCVWKCGVTVLNVKSTACLDLCTVNALGHSRLRVCGIYMYACMYVCMDVCMYVHTYCVLIKPSMPYIAFSPL
jgi:hypothetical protein